MGNEIMERKEVEAMKKGTKTALIISSMFFIIGIILVIIGIGMGAYNHTDKWSISLGATSNKKNLEETYSGISSIDFDFKSSEVIIQQGDRFHIKAENVSEKFSTYVQGTKWVIKEVGEIKFGFRFGLFGNNQGGKVVITLPKDVNLTSANIQMDVGSVNLAYLDSHSTIIDVDTGQINIENLITQSLETDVDTGGINIYKGQIKHGIFSSDVGKIYFAGHISGNMEVNADVGSVELLLDNSYNNFNYEVSCELGNVIIGEKTFSGIDSDKVISNGAIQSAKLECEVGNIKVEFK